MGLELQFKKDVVQNLRSSAAEKEVEIRSMNSCYERTKDELSSAHLQIQGLKGEILKSQGELEAKHSSIDDLYASVKSLTAENNDFRREFSVIEEKYNNLKLTADKKAALDAKLVREKEEELHQLKEKLEHALNEASRNQAILDELTREREILKDSLGNESNKENHLKSELQIIQENLGKSRNGTAQLERLTNESNKLHEELEIEVSALLTELLEVKESLQRRIDDRKLRVEMLTSQFRTAKEESKKSQVDLQSMFHEQTAAMENRNSLKRELVDGYEKAETAAKDLKEEKILVPTLSKDVQALESEVFKEQEGRKALVLDQEEATESLEGMNQNSLILSGQLKKSSSCVLDLEDDRGILHELLTNKKSAFEETQQNFEDAQNHLERLGMDIENLESKAKKHEDEFSSAKGEILCLRSEKISSSKVVADDEQPQKDEGESEVTVEKNVTQ